MIQILVGVRASIAVLMLMAAPPGRLLRTPMELLHGSPVPNFFIFGLNLCSVNGIGQCNAAYLTLKRKKSAPLCGAIFGLGLMIWIFIQVNMIDGGHIMQYSFFFIGVVETALAFLLVMFGINNEPSIAKLTTIINNLSEIFNKGTFSRKKIITLSDQMLIFVIAK